MNENLKLTPLRLRLITWTLLFIMPVIGMIVDLVAPSLPAMAVDIHVSESVIKNVITTFLFGYALGNFFTGFLTDALGRRNLIRIALLTFVIVSILPIFYPGINVILFSRFMQGVSSGAAAVLLRAIFADILPKEKLVKLGAVIGTVWGLGPIIGPVIGAHLQHSYGWQAGFYFFTIIGAVCFISVFLIVPETITQRQRLKYSVIRANCREILTNRVFIALPILMGIAYSLIITFHTAGPFLIQNILGYSPLFFGKLALCMGISFLLATFTARYLVGIMPVERIFQLGISLFLLIISILLVLSHLLLMPLTFIIVASLIMFFAAGILFPLSMGKGLSMFSHIAGTATAIMYLINGSITAASSFIISLLNVNSATRMLMIYFIMILFCAFIYRTMLHSKAR